jgi:hypothetical protein
MRADQRAAQAKNPNAAHCVENLAGRSIYGGEPGAAKLGDESGGTSVEILLSPGRFAACSSRSRSAGLSGPMYRSTGLSPMR